MSPKPVRTLLRTAAILGALAAIATLPAFAKDNFNFGKEKLAAPDWAVSIAKEATPEYAKSAGMVLLLREITETVDASGRTTERIRTAERLLNPQGRSNVGCGFSYGDEHQVHYFRSWTIDAAGKQFQAREGDFAIEGDHHNSDMLFAERMAVVRPPAVDIGSTFVCESEVVQPVWDQEGIWNLQDSDEPIALQRYEVILPEGRHLSSSFHNFKVVSPTQPQPNHWLWEIRSTPMLDLRTLRLAPDWHAVVPRLSVLWDDAGQQSSADDQWRAIGNWTSRLEADRTPPTPEITAQAQQLTAGATDTYSKLVRISEFVQRHIRYFIIERGIGGYQAHYAQEIYRNRYGDCKDKTALTISLLNAVGIKAYFMPVDDRRGVVDPESPSRAGNHMITAIEIPEGVTDPHLEAVVKAPNSKRYLIFDPTNETTPIGNLPSYLQGGWGLLSAGDESRILHLPVLKASSNTTEITGSFTLAEDATLTGSVTAHHSGPTGGEWRQMIRETDEKERRNIFEKYLARDLAGVSLDEMHFVQPESLAQPLELNYKLTAPRYAKSTGGMLLVRSRVVEDWTPYFDEKPRSLPINLTEAKYMHQRLTINLPAGYVVDDLPDPVKLSTDFGSYSSSVSVKDDKLTYERTLQVTTNELPANRILELGAFESAILRDQKAVVVLVKKP